MLRSCKFLVNSNLPANIKLFPAANAIRSYSSKSPLLEVKEENGIREITFNDEKTRHVLSMEMMCRLQEELTRNWDDKSLRCIVMSSKGPVWSAGHNLKEIVANEDRKFRQSIFDKLTAIIMDIRRAPVPVIGKVNGLAAAAGVQLVASCDIIVCSEKSQFSCPGANFGVFCSTPGIALTRVMHRPKTGYMLFTGLNLSAQEASVAGLVSRVVPESELDCEINNIADAIKLKSRAIIAFGKKFYYKQMSLPIEEAFEQASQIMCDTLEMKDSKEGLRSFVEKRKPQWSHE